MGQCNLPTSRRWKCDELLKPTIPTSLMCTSKGILTSRSNLMVQRGGTNKVIPAPSGPYATTTAHLKFLSIFPGDIQYVSAW
jgi:hypothetical protein